MDSVVVCNSQFYNGRSECILATLLDLREMTELVVCGLVQVLG